MRLLRSSPVWFALLCVGCGSSSFDVPPETSEAGGDDTSSSTSDGAGSDTDTSDTADAPDLDAADTGGAVDTGTSPTDTGTPPPTDAGCVAPTASDPDVYVDASVATSGKGSAGCPVKTILEGVAIPSSGARIVHVKAGSYVEAGAIKLRGGMKLLGEGGPVKVSGGSTSACTPHVETCLVQMEAGTEIDGIRLDASSVGNGLFASGSPKIKRTTVTNAKKDGIWLQNGGELGPSVHVDENGYAGVMSRGGALTVSSDASAPNSFDKNKGKGFFTGGSYTPAGGIVLMSGSLDFQGGSASGNGSSGIAFAWAGAGSSANQKISNLVAQNNGGGGVDVAGKFTGGLMLRSSVLTKNATFGLWFTYTGSSSVLDIGGGLAAVIGGNTFGGASDKNGKVGIFLCHSGTTASQAANGDKFASCAPSQAQAPNCDQYPPSYADIGYVPASGISGSTTDPVLATACTVGP